jgi:hypothetical protein
VEWHFCEACDQEYQFEVQHYLEMNSPSLEAGMSKPERAKAIQLFRDEMKRHMEDWNSGR